MVYSLDVTGRGFVSRSVAIPVIIGAFTCGSSHHSKRDLIPLVRRAAGRPFPRPRSQLRARYNRLHILESSFFLTLLDGEAYAIFRRELGRGIHARAHAPHVCARVVEGYTQ